MKLRMYLPVVVVTVCTLVLGAVGLLRLGSESGDTTTVAGLIRQLEDDLSNRRREAATALGQVVGPGAEGAAKGLIARLRDVDAQVRARSARSLGSLLALNSAVTVFDDAATALSTALSDPEPAVRASAAVGLRSIGREAEGMFEAAVEGLQGDDGSLQIESAAVLSTLAIRKPDDLRKTLALLEDPAPVVHRAARQALIRRGLSLAPEVALGVLAIALRSGPPAVREVAATMLGRAVVRVSATRDLLMTALNDRDASVRLAAAAAMGAFAEDTLARLALRLATDDPDLRVRATASASLAVGRRASKAEALADLKIALRHDPARTGLVEAVESDPDRASPRLIDALTDRDADLRAAAARCLGELPRRGAQTKPIVDALILALSDRDPYVRRASAAALARYGPAAALAAESLKRATRDADRAVSGQAFLTLQGLDETRTR